MTCLGKVFLAHEYVEELLLKGPFLIGSVPYTTVKAGMGQGVGFIGSMDHNPKIVF